MAIVHGTTVEVCYVTHDIERAIKHWAEILKAGPFYILNNDAGFGQRTYRGAPAKDSFRAASAVIARWRIPRSRQVPTNNSARNSSSTRLGRMC